MREIQYVIQCVAPNQVLYLQIDLDTLAISFVPKIIATKFTSMVLLNGWILKAQSIYRNYKFSAVQV